MSLIDLYLIGSVECTSNLFYSGYFDFANKFQNSVLTLDSSDVENYFIFHFGKKSVPCIIETNELQFIELQVFSGTMRWFICLFCLVWFSEPKDDSQREQHTTQAESYPQTITLILGVHLYRSGLFILVT